MSFDFTKLADTLAKEIGESAVNEDVKYWIPSGFLPLDHAISGSYSKGWPVGRMVEIFGPESSGKTWLATQAMISAQRMGGIAGFEDHERSFKLSLAQRLGLDTSRGRWFYNKPKTFEESISNLIRTVRAIRKAGMPMDRPIVWVYDSLASMTPKAVYEKLLGTGKEAEKADGQLNMRDMLELAKATSDYLKVVVQVADEYGVLVMFLNQIRLQPGVVYGNPEKTPGGNAPKYYSSVRVQLGSSRLTSGTGEDKIQIGSEVTARCIKNKVSRPFMKGKWRFMFEEDGSGRFAVVESLIEFAIEKELLPLGGAYVTWLDGKKYHRAPLAKKIEDEGLLPELEKLIVGSGVTPDLEELSDEELAA